MVDVSQWYSRFYWRDSTPNSFSALQRLEILKNSEEKCGLPNCVTKLDLRDGQFLHIKDFVEKNEKERSLVICPKCFDDLRGEKGSEWQMLLD